ncbi:MAG: hypothetical protein LBK18_07245 [Prevotellaceae bacterium]|nr:hypothetical protein [Prevotellaceae bacterium]
MKTRAALLSLVLGLSLSGFLFTQCMDNVESDGVRAVRQGYADKLVADAELQKANAEYKRAEAELQKVEVELQRVMVELKKVELDEAKVSLEELQEKLKTTLLTEQKKLVEAEKALVDAKKALAEAEAKALADNPKLTEYTALYNQLFQPYSGQYAKKSTLLSDKLSAQNDLLTLRYGVDAERVAWLKRDSVKAGEELKNAQDLLTRYESLDGLTVEQLQGKVNDAKLDWDKALLDAAQKSEAYTKALRESSEEDAKLTAENGKLTTLQAKIKTSGVTLTILDSLRYLNNYTALSFTGDFISQLSPVTKTGGYNTIVDYANGRLTYLVSSDTFGVQSTGFDVISSAPSYQYPTKRWLEYQIDTTTNATIKGNHQTVLTLVENAIKYYEGLVTEYKSLVNATNEEISAQVAIVNEQAKKSQEAMIASSEAGAASTTASTHATNLGAIYNVLVNPSTGTLGTIKTCIADLEAKIAHPSTGLLKKVADANQTLADYIAKGGGFEVIADAIAKKEAELTAIEANIAALDKIIAEIEAKMQALLQE